MKVGTAMVVLYLEMLLFLSCSPPLVSARQLDIPAW